MKEVLNFPIMYVEKSSIAIRAQFTDTLNQLLKMREILEKSILVARYTICHLTSKPGALDATTTTMATTRLQ